MTVIQASFKSDHLMRQVSYRAIMPSSRQALPTLYLLHGWGGDQDDYLLHTSILQLAHKYRIAVIMPNGENSYYSDYHPAQEFGKFIGQDLVAETRKQFHLATNRDQTWLAGLSMGGYGALRNALVYSETFSKVVAMSSRIMAKSIGVVDYTDLSNLPTAVKSAFLRGGYQDLPLHMDLSYLLEVCPQIPATYLLCGDQDRFLADNNAFAALMKTYNPQTIYEVGEGGHSWVYWNRVLEGAIRWLARS